jgi:hypothetical protein
VGRAEVGRHRARGGRLVERCVVKTDRERPHGAGPRGTHAGHDQTRVDAAGKPRAQRHVADQPLSHGLREQCIQFFERFGLIRRRPSVARDAVQHIPVTRQRQPAVAPHRAVPRRQLADLRQDASLAGHKAQQEIGRQRLSVEFVRDFRQPGQCVQLGGKRKRRAILEVEQRFLAQTVPRQEQFAASAVPKGQGEHPFEALHARGAPLLVRREDHFRIRPGPKAPAAPFQFGPKFAEVVDLAVEHDPDVFAIGGLHRLPARGREVNNAQAPVSQGDGQFRRVIGEDLHAGIVRSAMGKAVAHGADPVRRDRRIAVRQDARNAAQIEGGIPGPPPPFQAGTPAAAWASAVRCRTRRSRPVSRPTESAMNVQTVL